MGQCILIVQVLHPVELAVVLVAHFLEESGKLLLDLPILWFLFKFQAPGLEQELFELFGKALAYLLHTEAHFLVEDIGELLLYA